MATTRVYILANELGVKSSAIIEKCRAEELDVQNHMSIISAGLAATIREWFSEGENVTTVEMAEKVDLDRVRVKKKPIRTKKVKAGEQDLHETDQEQSTLTGVEVAEKPESEFAVESSAELTAGAVAEHAPKTAPQFSTEAPAETAQIAAGQTQAVAQAAGAAPAVRQPAETAPSVTEKAEPAAKEPQPVSPGGPMLGKPAPAKLTGPAVVRFEALEPHRVPKRRPRFDVPITEPLLRQEDRARFAIVPATDKKKPSKRHKEKVRGTTVEDAGNRDIKKVKSGKWRQVDIDERRARLDAAGGERLRLRPSRKISSKMHGETATVIRPQKVAVREPIIVKDLSAAMCVKSADIITKLLKQGIMATANQTISAESAELIALEFGTELVIERAARLEDRIKEEFEKRERTHLTRKPVVATMLGHVDHGKTSLLDKIRSTQVTATEAGGITQHIGAYQVVRNNVRVTFLDTPGHEAFTAMRARGATMTDVVVLVVAADDGIMPQTVEAIAHSKAANVPVIIALNKIDLPGCDINRIYSQFTEYELTPIEWGGTTDVVKTSAITGQGIEDLLEHLDYTAELLEFEADDTIPATGWVVEAKMSPQRGPVATVLLKEGQLKKGDIVLSGTTYGRIKTMKNSFGKTIKLATSAMPVEVMGLNGVPEAGDRFYCLSDINLAKMAAEENQVRSREKSLVERKQITLDNLFTQIEAGQVKELNLIIRADVQGSVDVLKKYLSELSTEEVKIKILHSAPGGITEGDVVLAEASNAIIIGFNVVADEQVSRIADAKKVDIRFYNIIYRITEDLRKSMVGLLEPEEREKTLGRAVVRQIFKVSKVGTIAGCYVSNGVATNSAKARLIRNNIVIRNDLAIESLKHFKDDAREVKAGLECGIKFVRFDDIKIDDVLEFYEIIMVDRTL